MDIEKAFEEVEILAEQGHVEFNLYEGHHALRFNSGVLIFLFDSRDRSIRFDSFKEAFWAFMVSKRFKQIIIYDDLPQQMQDLLDKWKEGD